MFNVIFQRNYDHSFQIGAVPIWFHNHGYEESKTHFHLLLNLGLWFLELQIGKDEPEE